MRQCYCIGELALCSGGAHGDADAETGSRRKWKKYQSKHQVCDMRASYKPASEKVLQSGNRLETEEVGPEASRGIAYLRIACQSTMWFLILSCLVNVAVYMWPMEEPQIEPKVAPLKPRPPLVGPLKVNSLLDDAQLLFEDQFHGPESMAWTAGGRSFYTGVEGGFILRIDKPYESQERRWSIVARLNAPQAIEDLSTAPELRFRLSNGSLVKYSDNLESSEPNSDTEEESNSEKLWRPFCELDQQAYGQEANWRPEVVTKSRCSRPLGLRLSPDGSRIYVVDPLSGLYLIKLSSPTATNGSRSESVTRLLDFSDAQQRPQHGIRDERLVLFADDLVVDWGAGENSQDVIYMSDCSRRWTLRYLLRMMIENDDSGRLLKFDIGTRVLEQVNLNQHSYNLKNIKLSFPNGLEMSANGSALLLSDLNNRRVLMHHLRGSMSGYTNLVLGLPGYPDNIRRGLDTRDGLPTYWAGCGCAVAEPGAFELSDDFNEYPKLRKGFMKLFHFAGVQLGYLGNLLKWNRLQEWATNIKSLWFTFDVLCMHGIVVQFDESGQILRSLQTPSHGSRFKVISQAHQVPAPNSSTNADSSYLFLGSVYYSHMGQLQLSPL